MRNPQHILITGASSGIGAALAELYAAPNIRLSLHGRHAERLEAVVARAKYKGALVTAKTGDVTNAEDLTAWMRLCDAIYPLDLVIANAGISGGTGGRNESEEQSRSIMDINVVGVMNTLFAAVPLMQERRRGQIAIISSLASFRGFPGAPAYCASKAAVRVYGESLRGSLANQNIEVNVVCPGFIKTPMTDVNRFPMPFLMPVDQAARLIRRGLERNQARIAFPWPMYWAVRFLAALPQFVLDCFAGRLPKKGG